MLLAGQLSHPVWFKLGCLPMTQWLQRLPGVALNMLPELSKSEQVTQTRGKVLFTCAPELVPRPDGCMPAGQSTHMPGWWPGVCGSEAWPGSHVLQWVALPAGSLPGGQRLQVWPLEESGHAVPGSQATETVWAALAFRPTPMATQGPRQS